MGCHFLLQDLQPAILKVADGDPGRDPGDLTKVVLTVTSRGCSSPLDSLEKLRSQIFSISQFLGTSEVFGGVGFPD